MYHVFAPALVFCLQLLGLLPVSVDRLPLGDSVARVTRPRRLYSTLCAASIFFVVVVWLWQSFFSEVTRPMFKANTHLAPAIMLTGFLSFLFHSTAALTCVLTGTSRAAEKAAVVERLREVDLLLHGPSSKQSKVPLVLVTMLTCVFVAGDVIDAYNFSIVNTIRHLHKVFTLFGIVEFAVLVLGIGDRFRLLNTRLVQAVSRRRARHQAWTIPLPFVETCAAQSVPCSLPSQPYHLLLLCSCDVTAIYGVQLAMVVLCLLLQLLALPHALYLMVPDPNIDRFTVIMISSWVLVILAQVLVIVWPCAATVHEAHKTSKIVNRLIGNRMDKRLSAELEQLSLQLEHSRVQFSACGLFNVDTPLIGSIISVVFTYLSLLVQLQGNQIIPRGAEATNISTSSVVNGSYSTGNATIDN